MFIFVNLLRDTPPKIWRNATVLTRGACLRGKSPVSWDLAPLQSSIDLDATGL